MTDNAFRIYDQRGARIFGRRFRILTGEASDIASSKRTAYLRRWAPFRVEGELPKRLKWVTTYQGGPAPEQGTRKQGRRITQKAGSGPGSELKALLHERYGIKTIGTCECNQRAKQMDERGIRWCENNIETIVGWLMEGASNRVWMKPLVKIFGGTVDTIARRIVQEAIERAKDKKQRPKRPTRKANRKPRRTSAPPAQTITVRPELMQETTILIRSFRRHRSLLRLIRSIHRHFPDVPILVGDDSGPGYRHDATKLCRAVPGVQWVNLGFDVGLPAGRNALLQRCETPTFILADDDFVFTQETRIDVLLHLLEVEALDIAGGLVRMDGLRAVNWTGRLEMTGKRPNRTLKTRHLVGGWKVTDGIRWRESDLTLNFFAARTETLRRHPWDERYTISEEHIDSLLEWWHAGLRIAYTLDAVAGHWHESSPDYRRFRRRSNNGAFGKKWGIKNNRTKNRIKEPAVPDRSVKQMLEQESNQG